MALNNHTASRKYASFFLPYERKCFTKKIKFPPVLWVYDNQHNKYYYKACWFVYVLTVIKVSLGKTP